MGGLSETSSNNITLKRHSTSGTIEIIIKPTGVGEVLQSISCGKKIWKIYLTSVKHIKNMKDSQEEYQELMKCYENVTEESYKKYFEDLTVAGARDFRIPILCIPESLLKEALEMEKEGILTIVHNKKEENE